MRGRDGDSSISLERSIRVHDLAAILQAFGRDAGGQAQLRQRKSSEWVLLDEENGSYVCQKLACCPGVIEPSAMT